jgi:tetratricopeptide (TPR) repeat protein
LCTTKHANCCKLIDVLDMRRLPRSASALAIGLALGAVTLDAVADTPSSESVADARLGQAKRKFEEGVRAFGERRYADAVQAFREADGIQPSAALSFNIARAYERLEDVPAALRWYRDYLRRNPEAANRADVDKQVAGLARQLEARGVQQVSVLARPEGAQVLIDDRAEGVAPFTTEIPPGKHHVSVRAGGYRTQELDFSVEPGTPRDLSVVLEKLAPDAPDAIATTPPPPSPKMPPPPAPAARKPPLGVVPWIVLGAGAATSLGALGFELARRSAESDAEQSAQLDYPRHFEAMQSRQTTARVLGVAGGVLLLGGATS